MKGLMQDKLKEMKEKKLKEKAEFEALPEEERKKYY